MLMSDRRAVSPGDTVLLMGTASSVTESALRLSLSSAFSVGPLPLSSHPFPLRSPPSQFSLCFWKKQLQRIRNEIIISKDSGVFRFIYEG